MTFSNYLSTAAAQINKELTIFLAKWQNESAKDLPHIKPLLTQFAKTVNGGKSVRGTLVKLGYELSGSPVSKNIFKPAAAYEILHTSLIIHDDIMDRSPLRRGKPSLYQQLGGDHYGMSQAICLGDVGFFLATKLLATSEFNINKKNQVMSFFSETVLQTIYGQMLDLAYSQPNKQTLTDDDILNMHHRKTAQYTFVGPLTIGAILGGGKQNLLNNIQTYGQHIGIAFQLQDDILGIFGEQTTMGKSNTSDIEEGKNTLLFTYAMNHANTSQKNFLKTHYGKGSLTQHDYNAIRTILTDTGALAYSQQKAIESIEQGKTIIPKISKNPQLQTLLHSLADFSINRKK